MELANFVPTYPAIGYGLLASGAIGLPFSLRALFLSGGPPRTLLAALLGPALATTIATLTLLKGNSLFVWHVIGMSMGILAFQPAAMHAILCKHAVSDAKERASRVFSHKLLQIATVGCVAPGFAAIYLNKPAGFPGKHFMSIHSLVGLLAMALMLYNMLDAGYRQGNPLSAKLNWVSALHRFAGTCAFVASFCALILGLFNRTAVVDWEQRPIRFSVPEGWNQMGGWAMSTHGKGVAGAAILTALSVLLLLLFPGPKPAPAKDGKKKKR